jgi:peptide/nickel transport system substrate-binding protein
LPYAPESWAYDENLDIHPQDIAHANVLLTSSQTASQKSAINLTIKTLEKYKKDAEKIAAEWKKIGVTAKIETVDSVPSSFQIFLGDFIVPKDPDQYTLWHSGQENNITGYNKVRIDKLLEDGRKVTDTPQRKKLYSDFQKYIYADSPAAFLFFPYEYEITRK